MYVSGVGLGVSNSDLSRVKTLPMKMQDPQIQVGHHRPNRLVDPLRSSSLVRLLQPPHAPNVPSRVEPRQTHSQPRHHDLSLAVFDLVVPILLVHSQSFGRPEVSEAKPVEREGAIEPAELSFATGL